MENVINVSDIKKLIATAHATLCVVIHALDTKILVGEINRPADPITKVTRKRRTKKEIMQSGQRVELTPKVKMNLEKEYQSGRTSDLILPSNVLVTAHDRGSTYLNPPVPPLKTKKERKKREKKGDGGDKSFGERVSG